MTAPESGNLPQPDRPVERWQPKKEFYLKDPRATQIREVSLRITNVVGKLLDDHSVSRDRQEQEELYKDLEVRNGELIHLGIQPNMHEGDSLESFKESPVKMAEYLAGQICNLTGRHIPSFESMQHMIAEFGEISPDQGLAIAADPSSVPNLEEFAVAQTKINRVNTYFDAEHPESTEDNSQS